MTKSSIPKDPEAWIEFYKTLGNNNTRAFAPTQEGEKSKHGSASQATLTTLLHYRILWKKEYSCDPMEIWFSHRIFRGNTHLKNRISQKVNTLATSEANSARCFGDLLRKIAESKGNFPTPADETEILNSSSMQTFGNFVHCLRQINSESSTQQHTPSLDSPQENRIYVHSVDSESLLVTPAPRCIIQLEQRHKQNQNFNAEMSQTTREENIKRHLSPLLPKGYHMAGDNDDGDNGDGDSDDGDSDGVGDVTFQESSSPDFIQKGSVDSSKEVDSPMPLPPGGNNVPIPQPRAALSEQTVVLTCINLLITISQQVGNRALFVTAENRMFAFHDYKGTKIWEGRCDGLVFMSSPEKKEAIFGIIEAKRGLRTDDVRYQEGAEMVALIRDQERRGVRNLDTSWVIGVDGDQLFITIASWGKAYTAFLNQLGNATITDFEGFLDEDSFLTMIEYGPFSMRHEDSIKTFIIHIMYLMELGVEPCREVIFEDLPGRPKTISVVP